MKENLLLLSILAILTLNVGAKSKLNNPIKPKSESENFDFRLNKLNAETAQLKLEISKANATILELEKRHEDQIEYYCGLQRTITWIVGIFFLILSGAFTAFIWFFKQPDEVFKKLKTIEKDASEVLKCLDDQFQYQKIRFISGDKGLSTYTFGDWTVIKNYSEIAYKTKKQKRSANDWFFIGLWEYHKENFVVSISAFKEAIKIDNDFELAYKNLGNAYEGLSDYDNAIKAYNEVIRINAQNPAAYNNLGVIFGGKKDFEHAKQYFIKAIKIKPTYGYFYTNLFENDLISNQEFDKDIERVFIENFKNDIAVYPIYEMLVIYQKITKNENPEPLFENWTKLYSSIGSNESYKAISEWINNIEDVNIKVNLSKAMEFFKNHEEKDNL